MWGATSIKELSFLDHPPSWVVAEAKELLYNLGALNQDGLAKAHGRALCRLPLHPRVGHMVLEGETCIQATV